jgi:RES domain
VIWFRHADRRWPFLWENTAQPEARWHGAGEGPAQYLADTPDGAWAEFLRHEEITDPADLPGIDRQLWAVEVPNDEPVEAPSLSHSRMRGGRSSYGACQAEARRLRTDGATGLEAPSAALVAGGARGQVVRGGLREAQSRDGQVLVLFGTRDDLRGWVCADYGRPGERVLALVHHF